MHSTTQSSYNHIPEAIFKAYDIRGIVGKTLTPRIVEAIGHALGSEAACRKQTSICIGYDGRLSSPELAAALSKGILKSGINVIQLGLVATPVVYFSTHYLKTKSGVMITGSHNPPEYNGLKMVLDGEALSGQAIQQLLQRIKTNNFIFGNGQTSHHDLHDAYIHAISDNIQLNRPMKIAIDCGNGAASIYAERLFQALGCQVETLFCTVDGHFPNHHPDPSIPENLEDLMQALQSGQSEIGLAFDGDADRLGIVTKEGHIIYPDRLLLLFVEDLLKRKPGATIIYDVKSTRHLSPWIKANGGQPLMWKTGHSLVKAKMQESGAALAGEMTGHFFFTEGWYGFDDGLYAGARLLAILSHYNEPSAILNALPDSVSTPEQHIHMQEGEPHALVAKLQQTVVFDHAVVSMVDGIRADYTDGFGLMRASNTIPVLVLRFEADTQMALARIQDAFKTVILAAMPDLALPF